MSKELELGHKTANEQLYSLPDVMLHLFCMKAAIEKNVLNSSVGKEFEGVFNQRRVCERKETLFVKNI